MNRTIKVGRTASGERVTVEIAVYPVGHEYGPRDGQETTEHGTAGPDAVRLSISGEVTEYRRREPWQAGQCVEALDEITEPAPGWTPEMVRELRDIWQRWHLNDMRAGCAHVTPIIERDRYGRDVPSLDHTPACPVTGYRYGHAWLYEPIPADVLERVRVFQRYAGR